MMALSKTFDLYSQMHHNSLAVAIEKVRKNVLILPPQINFPQMSAQKLAAQAISLSANIDFVTREFTQKHSFCNNILATLQSIDTTNSDLFYEQAVSSLEEQFSKIKTSDKSSVDFSGQLGLLFAVIVLIYSVYCQKCTDDKLNEICGQLDIQNELIKRLETKGSDAEKRILQAIQQLLPDSEEECYTAVRKTYVCATHKRQSARKTVLYPNQIVIIKDSRKKKVYIEYFDFTDGKVKNGWILKKYIRKLSK